MKILVLAERLGIPSPLLMAIKEINELVGGDPPPQERK